MKSLVVYCSSHGTTEKAAHFLTQHVKGDVVTLNLNQKNSTIDLDSFDVIMVGGSIHAGMIQRKVKKFIAEHQDLLMRKQLGLFLCCMYEGEIAKEQFANAFPSDLREHSRAEGLFGGEFLISHMNFIEKMIVKKVSGVTDETSNLNYPAIQRFSDEFNKIL
jgi:menaquinone-dependent protoporphyrinogen oxidase